MGYKKWNKLIDDILITHILPNATADLINIIVLSAFDSMHVSKCNGLLWILIYCSVWEMEILTRYGECINAISLTSLPLHIPLGMYEQLS